MIWIFLMFICFISMFAQKYERLVGLIAFAGMGWIAGNPNPGFDKDMHTYLYYYQTGEPYFEKGYNLIVSIARPYLTYAQFRLITSMIVYLLIFAILSWCTTHVASVGLLYGLAVFPVDSMQVRNAMAAVFILLGAALLVKFENKGVIPALFVIAIGTLFHSLALIFLLLPILWLIREYITQDFVVPAVIIVIFSAIIELLGTETLTKIAGGLVSLFSNRKGAGENVMTVYAKQAPPLYEWLFLLAVTVFMIFLAVLIKQYATKSNLSYLNLFFCAAIIWGGGLILSTISIDYIRVLRITCIFFILMWINIVSDLPKRERYFYLCGGIAFACLMLGLNFWAYGFSLGEIRSFML